MGGMSISLQGKLAVVHVVPMNSSATALSAFDLQLDQHDHLVFSSVLTSYRSLLCWGPDGRFLILVSRKEHGMQVYDAATWSILTTIPTFDCEPMFLAWSPTGTCLAYLGLPPTAPQGTELFHDGLIDFAFSVVPGSIQAHGLSCYMTHRVPF